MAVKRLSLMGVFPRQKNITASEIASTLPDNTQHISLVYHPSTERRKKYHQLQTLLDISEGFRIDTRSFNDKEPCRCSTIEYDADRSA